MDLMDIYRTFHLKAAEYRFFSNAHGFFFRKDHILGHKAILGKFKKIEIISSIFSDNNTMRWEINYQKGKKSLKNTNMWRLNQYATKEPMTHWKENELKSKRKLKKKNT